MTVQPKEYPFYLKTIVILIGLILLTYIFSVLGDILVPLAFAAFFAVLLNPLCNRLLKWRLPKIAAILLSLLLAVIFIAGIFYFLSTQIAQFSQSFPALKQKFIGISQELEHCYCRACIMVAGAKAGTPAHGSLYPIALNRPYLVAGWYNHLYHRGRCAHPDA